MRPGLLPLLLVSALCLSCAAPSPPSADASSAAELREQKLIAAVIDDWHDAAAHADEPAPPCERWGG